MISYITRVTPHPIQSLACLSLDVPKLDLTFDLTGGGRRDTSNALDYADSARITVSLFLQSLH